MNIRSLVYFKWSCPFVCKFSSCFFLLLYSLFHVMHTFILSSERCTELWNHSVGKVWNAIGWVHESRKKGAQSMRWQLYLAFEARWYSQKKIAYFLDTPRTALILLGTLGGDIGWDCDFGLLKVLFSVLTSWHRDTLTNMSPSNKLLVLNSGSSSLKFKLYQVASGGLTSLASGLCERIGDTSKSSIKVPISYIPTALWMDHFYCYTILYLSPLLCRQLWLTVQEPATRLILKLLEHLFPTIPPH